MKREYFTQNVSNWIQEEPSVVKLASHSKHVTW